ncbi:hypothetical protein OQA88_10593 [Cercophora sp. LCS_1]
MSPPKRTIVITGCSDGGLGAALALTFHKTSQWRILATARNPAKLTACTAAGIETLTLDVLSPESITAAVAQVASLTNGTLDCILHNAGAGFTMPLMDVDVSKARDLFDLNVWSILSVTQAFLPLLRAAAPGAMVVINTSGSATPAGMLPFAGVYNASKAAAMGLAETMRLELEVFGIRTVNLVTGAVRTNFGVNRVVEPKLPQSSMYVQAGVGDLVEGVMDNEELTAKGADAMVWAEEVVRKLSGRKPAYWIWAGGFTTVLRIAGNFPVGMWDFVMKRVMGVTKVEETIRRGKEKRV